MKKNKAIIIATVVLTKSISAQLVPLGEHVDIRCHYDRAGDTWACQALTSGGAGSELLSGFDGVFLPLGDRPYAASTPAVSGARHVQPASAAYDFTGVAAGNPIWIAVQGTPGNGEAWPGFENAQNTGTFGEYLETDLRLAQPQTLARPWIKVALKEVIYQGSGPNPAFSMWTVSGFTPRVWMATADGLDAGDCFLYSAGSHVHMNWGFGETGIYRLRFTATAFRGPGKTNPTAESESFTVTFAVGPVAGWQALHFGPQELENAGICGLSADPDEDGLTNLTEYAFGLHPRMAGRAGSPGLTLPRVIVDTSGEALAPVLEFPRRRAGLLVKPLAYTAEFSNLESPDGWLAGGDETVEDFTGELAPLNATWEKVRVKMAPAPGRAAGFGRVRLEQED